MQPGKIFKKGKSKGFQKCFFNVREVEPDCEILQLCCLGRGEDDTIGDQKNCEANFESG